MKLYAVPKRDENQDLSSQTVERKTPTLALSPNECAKAWLWYGSSMESLSKRTGKQRSDIERNIRRAIVHMALPPIPCSRRVA